MFNKKNLPIIISVSLSVSILVAGLFWIAYYKKGDFFRAKQDNSTETEIKKQTYNFDQIRKKYNIPEPTPELIQKQKEEITQIRKELSIPKPTPELIQKQKEEMEKIRQRIMP